MKVLVIALLLSAAALPAAAGDPIYRYTDANGIIHFTDRPPDRHAKPIRMSPLSGTSVPRETGAKSKSAKSAVTYTPEALREAARFSVRVESPTPGERVAAGTAPTVVAASVMPGLVKGYRLVYEINGKAMTPQPVDALSVALKPLPPGAHALVVVLLDPGGKEIARSGESRFDVTRPTDDRSAPKTIARTELVH